MKKHYLVTGGAGFIGSHLSEKLLRRGDDVTILDNMTSGKLKNLEGFGDSATVIEGDIRDAAAFERVGDVDAIIHLAALISGYDSLSAPDDYEDVNVRGTLRLIEFAARRKIERIVFASSSTVYGSNSEGQISEQIPPAPLTVYGLTKLVGEHLLELYGRLHGFSHCSLRLFNVYGPRQAEDHPYANVTCKFSHAAVNGLPIKLYGDGEQSRDFIHVSDVVNAFLAVLPGAAHPIYNVGTQSDHSINHMMGVLEEITGRPFEVEQCGSWNNDIRQIRADTSRLAGEFGFAPATGLKAGLEDTVAFFRSARS